MIRRLLAASAVVAFVCLQAWVANANMRSDSGTDHNVTQTLTLLYNAGTCNSANYVQITEEEISWTRTSTTYKASASGNRTEEVGTKCDTTPLQDVDDWSVSSVCWKPCTGNAFASSTYIHTYTWPKIILSGGVAHIGGSGHGVIVEQATGTQVGEICTPVPLFNTVDCTGT